MPTLVARSLYFALNTVRVISIVVLAAAVASNLVLMVRDANAICREMSASSGPKAEDHGSKSGAQRAYVISSTVPLQPGGAFFAIISRLLVVCLCLILSFAELGRPKDLFAEFLPILGPRHGVGILGTLQLLLSAGILSHRIPKFALVPAFLLFAIGCLNILLGLVFCENIHSYRAWDTRLGKNECSEEPHPSNRRTSFRPGNEKSANNQAPQAISDAGFGRQAQQRVEMGGHSVPIPEKSYPKH